VRKETYPCRKDDWWSAGEKDRWTTIVADLTIQATLVVGDSLIAAGAISYVGSFTAKYREELEEIWRTNLVE